MTRICFPSGLKQAFKVLASQKYSDWNGPEIQCPVSESQTYRVPNNDVETKVFSSGDKTMHSTGSLWCCSETKIFFGHWEGLPSLMVRVFGNLGWNFSPMRERLGVNGRAERYIWGALWEMGTRNTEMNRTARYNTLASTRGLEDAWGRSRRVLIKELRLEGGRRLLRGV